MGFYYHRDRRQHISREHQGFAGQLRSNVIDQSDHSSYSEESLEEERDRRLHLAALASLKGEIIELKHRLQSTAIERDGLERKLAKAQVERSRLIHENDDRLEQQAIRYEERITELHSVIAELNKKIDRTQGDTIREEDEFSQSASSPPSNISNSGGSCNGSCFHGSESIQIDQCNDLNAELTRVFEGIECSIPSRKELHQHVTSMEQQAQQLDSASKQSQQRALQVMKEVEALNLDSSSDVDQASKMQRRRSSLEQELRILQEENENLNTSISRKDDEMLKMKANLMTVREEREKFRRKVREMQAMISTLQNQNGNHRTGHSSSSEHLGSPTQRPSPAPSHTGINPSTGELSLTGSERKKEMAVSKVAERVKLKQSRSADLKPGHDPRQVLGHEISAAGIQNSKLAEHLAHSLQECSSLQEVFQTLNSHGLSIPENKVREFEVEMERLNSKIEHLKSQNDLLSLTLEESKANCDRLSMLVGKYESNNTALQMAVNYSDQTIEALKTQLDLAQCEQQSLLANCKAAGLGGLGENSESSGDDSEDTTSMLRRVHENKKIAESMAKSLLQRLDRSCGAVLTHVQGATLQPWEDVSSQSHTSTTSSTASSCDTEFSKEDEQRLKDYVQQLKNDRAAVRLTVMELESVHIDPLSHDVAPRQDTQRLDLENAVLMQELTALKEERAELKAQNYLQDKERKALELKLSSREAQEEAYLVQINNLKCEMKEQMSHHSGGSDKGGFTRPHYAKNGLSSPVSLAEVHSLDDHSVASQDEFIQREKKMKSRIQELVTTLEKVQKSSELRHQQSSEFVADLKRANSALVTAYEKAKKKHQSRLKKLEAQMLAMVERHDTQVRMLKQRIALLEEENQATRRPHNETSL
ncbi:colorectal mutant cancer protein-like isoform X2 [Anneissia japonica]|uniref:colorectal mutant cancer protein-like isoform X2 n=1 Tax=Anneissia japonica TaxID=1529436 RepID=UPI001425AC9A|nr:colorectal mutant cancer protein-like isoform X2 [Anneissia japonica]